GSLYSCCKLGRPRLGRGKYQPKQRPPTLSNEYAYAPLGFRSNVTVFPKDRIMRCDMCDID
ncbi:hypothetical protein BDN67DRAFT_964437, partial [Paxillus ammoniavirescens]